MKNWRQFLNENIDYSDVNLKWIKSIFLKHSLTEWDYDEIYNLGKNKIKIELFQPLYEYYKFCKINKNFSPKCYTITEWVKFLFILQVFSSKLKKGEIDLYTDTYDEYLKLPRLTGDLNKDSDIMNYVIDNFFLKKDGYIRNNIMRFYIRFGDYMKNYFSL